MTSNVLSNHAWAQARERFVEDLDESEKTQFVNATFENIFYGASAAQKAHQANSVSRAQAAKLNTLLMGIDGWGKALDVYSNAAAMILCPLWGSIRVLIHLSSEFGKYFDYLVDMLAQIGEVVPRFQIYERLFSSHLRLTQALATAYLDVIVFCTKVKAVFKRAKRHSAVNVRVLLKIVWRSVDKDFGVLMTRFQRHKKSVEKEAGISNLLEEGKAREIESEILLRLAKQKDEEERIRILERLSSVQWAKQHWKALKRRQENTGTWVFGVDVFKNWKEMASSSCLRCHGIPGCGKTILSAGVIETLSSDVDRDQSAIAYFYCDYADSITLDVNSIIGAIIQQLLIANPIIFDSVSSDIQEAYRVGMRYPSPDRLVELLCTVIDAYTLVYIVLDGIDETSSDTQASIVGLVKTITAIDTTIVKVFVSSRWGSLLCEELSLYPEVTVSENDTVHDVNAYIKALVAEKLAKHSVIEHNRDLQAEVERQLMMNAQGMFLWVFLQVEELSDPSHSEYSFRSAIQDLPKGLIETYQRISQRIDRKSERQVRQANRIFTWMLGAKRYLTLSELREAIAIDPGDQYWDRSKISAEVDGKRLIENCGALVLFDETDNTVRLAHHTVAQYLRQQTFRAMYEDHFIADICFTYLSFSDFETQLVLPEKKQTILKEESSAGSSFSHFTQLLGLNKWIYDFLFRLQSRGEGRLPPDVDYLELLKRYQKASQNAPFEEKYQLLSYVRQYWIWHTAHFDKVNTSTTQWRALRDLVFFKYLPFGFRPWGVSEGPKDVPHLTVFLWALEQAHKSLLLLLAEQAPLSHYLNHSTTMQLEQLITKGQADVLALLMKEDSSIASNQEFIQQVFQSQRMDAVRLLFSYSDRANEYISKNILTRRPQSLGISVGLSGHHPTAAISLQPLHVAAYEGNAELSKLLLNHNANVNGIDSTCRTPLFYACGASRTVSEHDMADTVQLLIEKGAKIDAKDEVGESPLQFALRQRLPRDKMAEILIAEGADIYSKNFSGESILETAVSHASASTLRLLRERGYQWDKKDSEGLTPLLQCLSRKSFFFESFEERALALVASNADVNAYDKDKLSALHLAVREKFSTNLVISMLNAGAKINARDSRGRLAIDIAVALDSKGIVQTFIAYGVNLRTLDPRWEPALIYPILHGRNEMVKILLAGGADPSAMDHGHPSKSALAYAVIFDRLEIVNMLLHYGATVRPLGPGDLCDPFRWAITKGHISILRLLFQNLKPHEKTLMYLLWDYKDWRALIDSWNLRDPNSEDEEGYRRDEEAREVLEQEMRKLDVRDYDVDEIL